jgi:hypothetical protein
MGEDDDITEVDKVLAGQKQQTDATRGLLNTMNAANKLQADYTKQISGITKMLGMKRKFGIGKDPEMVNTLKALKQQLKDIKKDLRAAQKADVQKALKKAGGESTGHHWMQSMKTSLSGVFAPLTKAFKPITSVIGKIGSKVTGSLKKSGMMPMLGMAGAGILAGVMGKVVSSSPLLQSMMKMMNMAMTLIFRPIGDFIGSIMRPLMISFIKDIAVPMFKQSKGLMKQGEAIGKGLLGFFTDPIKSIHSAIILGLNSVLPASMLGGQKTITEAQAFQANPTAFARRGAGVGEFSKSKSFSIVPTDSELLDAGYTAEEIGNMDEFRTGYSWRKLQGARENDIIPGEYDMDQKLTLSGMKDIPGTGRHERIYGDEPGMHSTTVWDNAPGSQLPKEKPSWYDDDEEEQERHNDEKEDNNQDEEDEQDRHNDETKTDNEEEEEEQDRHNDETKAGNEEEGYIQSEYNKNNRKHNTNQEKLNEKVEKETNTWWDNVLEFFGLQDKEKEVKEEQITEEEKLLEEKKTHNEEVEKADDNWWTAITGFIDNIFKGGEQTAAAFEEVGDTLKIQNENIAAAANLATGGLFSKKVDPKNLRDNYGAPTDPSKLGMPGYDVLEASGSLDYLKDKKTVFGVPSAMSAEGAKAESLRQLGGSPLGDIAGNRFESSPGKFVDIYRNIEGVKTKIDPGSAEGIKIQGIYNAQHQKHIRNAAQTAHTDQVRGFTTSAESQAYLMAGGGQAGLKAAALAKEHGIDSSSPAGVLALASAIPEIKQNQPDLVKGAESLIPYTDGTLAVGAQYQANVGKLMSLSQGTFGMGNTMSTGSFDPSFGQLAGKFGQATTNAAGSINTGSGFTRGNATSTRGSGNSSSGTTSGSKSGGTGGGKGSTGGRKGAGGKGTGGGSKGTGGGGGKASGKKGSAGKGRRGAFGAIIDEPIVGIGMNTGQEWVLGEAGNEVVTPVDSYDGGMGNIIIHIGNITKEADYMKLKPLIQRWILESASRRGTV